VEGAPGRVLAELSQDRLLRYLDADPQLAQAKYRLLREKLVKYFDHNGCLDPDDRADEVFCRALERLAGGLDIFAANPASFFWGIARNVRLEWLRRPPEESLDAADFRLPIVSADATTSAAFLAECLDSLKSCERAFLMLWYSEGVERLSRKLGISQNSVRLRVHRIRLKLKRFAGPGGEGVPEDE
jgi:RNA polymerase sigma factor (sigma-70 family)